MKPLFTFLPPLLPPQPTKKKKKNKHKKLVKQLASRIAELESQLENKESTPISPVDPDIEKRRIAAIERQNKLLNQVKNVAMTGKTPNRRKILARFAERRNIELGKIKREDAIYDHPDLTH